MSPQGPRTAGGPDAGARARRRPPPDQERQSPDEAGSATTSSGAGLWRATGFLRRLRGGIEQGAGIAQAAADAATELPRGARDGAASAARRLAGGYQEDEWGLDDEFAEAAIPLLELLYERWWRVKVDGVENVPSHGRALLVANHAGIVPFDATMIGMSIVKRHPLPRYPRFLVLDWAFELPYVSVALRKLGSVSASPYNALRLLEQDELVGVFPEGIKGTGKAFRDRYRLQRFGRGGFVDIALRTGAPIIPVAVVGSEEIYPKIGELPLLARVTNAPFFPVTPTFPLLGPLGLVPLPSRWRIRFCEPIDVSSYGPEAAGDRALSFELSERVRETIQEALYATLVERGPAFF